MGKVNGLVLWCAEWFRSIFQLQLFALRGALQQLHRHVCVCTTSCNKNQVGETPKILKINFNVCVVHAAFQSLEKSSSIAVNLKRETTFYERTP